MYSCTNLLSTLEKNMECFYCVSSTLLCLSLGNTSMSSCWTSRLINGTIKHVVINTEYNYIRQNKYE